MESRKDTECKNLTKNRTQRADKFNKVDIDLYAAMPNEQSNAILI